MEGGLISMSCLYYILILGPVPTGCLYTSREATNYTPPLNSIYIVTIWITCLASHSPFLYDAQFPKTSPPIHADVNYGISSVVGFPSVHFGLQLRNPDSASPQHKM
jgi:hypothetical protein